ncbi:MAG: hypothetical protein ACOYNY_04820 [Caldilineaceae bacterium]
MILSDEQKDIELARPVFARVFIFFVAIYLVVGNLARLIALPGLRDNLPITVFFLYTIGLMYILLHPSVSIFILRIFPLVGIIAISTLYGSIVHGFQLIPTLYAIRLIFILVISLSFGHMLYAIYGLYAEYALRIYVYMYIVIFFAGIIMYIAFPDSVVLWNFLNSYNIVFNGDPHQHRFYSTYLDPNYYAAIACLPIILCSYLYNVTKKIIYICFVAMFIFSVVLSGSRSGGATLVAVLFIIGMKEILRLFHLRVKRNTLLIFCLLIILSFSFLPLYINNLTRIFERIASISTDPSAYGRLTSFQYGLELLFQFPLLGTGYHYIYEYMKQVGVVASVDSSMLATLINFGLILTITLLLIFLLWTINFLKNVSALKFHDFKYLCINYFLYLVLVICFTSQFNNLLYYEFWLFPMFSIGVYLEIVAFKLSRIRI